VLHELNAVDEERVEGRDYERAMPAWSTLAEPGTWGSLGEAQVTEAFSTLPVLPLLSHAMTSLHDAEVVVRKAAVAALKGLVHLIVDQDLSNGPWKQLLLTSLVPGLRTGVAQLKDTAREVSKSFICTRSET
jgi:hypothetical protein